MLHDNGHERSGVWRLNSHSSSSHLKTFLLYLRCCGDGKMIFPEIRPMKGKTREKHLRHRHTIESSVESKTAAAQKKYFYCSKFSSCCDFVYRTPPQTSNAAFFFRRHFYFQSLWPFSLLALNWRMIYIKQVYCFISSRHSEGIFHPFAFLPVF